MDSPTVSGNSEHAVRMNRGTFLLLACLFAWIVRQTLLIRQRATTVDFSAVDTFAGIDIAIVFIAAFVLLFSGTFFRATSSICRNCAVWLLGYYLLCAASSAWSGSPIYTLYRSFEYVTLFLATFGVVAQLQGFKDAERGFLYVAMVTIVLQALGQLRLSHFSISVLALHTNTYTASSAILFCYCLGEYLAMNGTQRAEQTQRARRLRSFAVFSLCTLAVGTSATSNVAAAAGCLLVFLSLRRISLFAGGLFAGAISFSLALAFGGGEQIVRSILFPGKSEYAVQTASGRTQIWTSYWHKFLESPLIGYGFGVISGGRDRALAALSHNSLFTVLIGTGIAGALVFSTFSIGLWCNAVAEGWRKRRGAIGFAGALAVAFVNCLGMPLMADRWETTSIVFVWLLALFLLHIRSAKESLTVPVENMAAGNYTITPAGCASPVPRNNHFQLAGD